MATNDKSYVENLKELRAIRAAQLKQMTQEARANSLLIEYNKRMLRQNEMMTNSIKDLSTKMVSSFANLSSKLVNVTSKVASGTVGAAGTAVGAAASVTGSIVSGLAKMLPFAIAGIAGKALLWDNMSSDTQKRLSDSFGKLIDKLISPVKEMFGGWLDKFKSMTFESPLLNTLGEKLEALVGIVMATAEYMEPFFDKIISVMKTDPTKLLMDALKITAGAVFLRDSIPIIGSIVLSMFGNAVLVKRILKAMETANLPVGIARGGSTVLTPYARGGGRGAPASAGAAGAAGGAAAPKGARSNYGTYKARLDATKAKQLEASMTVAKRSLGKVVGRTAVKIGSAFLGPIGVMVAWGFTLYEIYEVLEEYGLSEEEADQAVNEYFGKPPEYSGEGEYAGVPYAQPVPEEAIVSLEQMKAKKEKPVFDLSKAGNPGALGAEIMEQVDVDLLETAIKTRQKAHQAALEQKKLEDKTIPAKFVVEQFHVKWDKYNDREKRSAIDYAEIMVETANYYYLAGDMKGTIVRVTFAEYAKLRKELEANILDMTAPEILRKIRGGNQTASPTSSEPVKVQKSNITPSANNEWEALKSIIRKYESGDSYDKPYGGKLVNGQMTSPYANLPAGKKGLTEMTGQEVLEYQLKQIAGTKGKIGKKDPKTGEEWGTGAVGAYQFNYRDVLKPFYDKHPELLDKPFDKAMQDRIADWWKDRTLPEYGDDMEKFITSQWEIFPKNKKAKDELIAELKDKKIAQEIAQANDTQTDDLKNDDREVSVAHQQKNALRRIEYYIKKLRKPGDMTPLLINGKPAFEFIVDALKQDETKKPEEEEGEASKFIRLLKNPESLQADLIKKMDEVFKKQAEREAAGSANITNVVNNKGGDTIITNSGGGGSSTPLFSPIGVAAGYATQFNSLAGIGRQ